MNHPQVPLGEVADFVNGAAFKPEDWGDDGLPIIRIQNLTDSGKPFNYTERIVPEKLVVNPGDLLVSWSATLGVFQWNGPKGLLNQHIFRVLPNDEVVDKNYLKHTLGQAISDMERHLHGATMKHVNRGEFLGTMIPLPPLEEQRRIAAILDKSHSIQGLLLQRHRMLEALINSMLISGFGSPTEWPLKWEMQKLGDCCECLDRYRRPVKESERQEGHIPYYGANGQQGWIDDFLFDESLVLVAEDGGHFADRRRGVAYRINGKAWVNNHAHILRPRGNDLEIEFLHRILRHYDFVPYISGSTRSKLTQGQLNEVPIPVPPIDRQRSFSRCVEKLVSSLGTSSKSLKAAESLSRSLAQSILESEK
jgi:type I restriction enzyme S subunit